MGRPCILVDVLRCVAVPPKSCLLFFLFFCFAPPRCVFVYFPAAVECLPPSLQKAQTDRLINEVQQERYLACQMSSSLILPSTTTTTFPSSFFFLCTGCFFFARSSRVKCFSLPHDGTEVSSQATEGEKGGAEDGEEYACMLVCLCR